MLVKHHEKGWEIISHYAHGLLSGKIAQELKKGFRPSQWVDVLTGIIEHDDHLLDFKEQDHLTENGTPRDFTMEGGTDAEALEHAERVFANAMQKSQLVALMVGRHLAFLYEGLSKDYEPMDSFLMDVAFLRKNQRKLYGLKKKDEDALYDAMRFCDRLSLILCQGETPEVGRKLEVNRTIEDETYYIWRGEGDRLLIEPWPFEKNNFALQYEYRILEQATFADNGQLERAIDSARICLRTCQFAKP